MATGVQTNLVSDRYVQLRIVDGTAVDVAAPSAATSGVELPENLQGLQTERAFIAITDRSGSGVLSITYAKVWGYIANLGKWFPLGTGVDADRGKLNDAQAIGEVAADDLRLIEAIGDFAIFDRIAVELNTVAGTNPVIDVDLLIPRQFARYGK